MIDKVESPLYSEIGFKVLAPGLLPAQENNGDILLSPRNTLKKFHRKARFRKNIKLSRVDAEKRLSRLGLINMNFGAKYWRPQYA